MTQTPLERGTAGPRLVRLSAARAQRPAQPVLLHATALRNQQVRSDYWSLRLEAPAIAERAQPGQFVMLTVARLDEASPILPRPMAIYAWDRTTGTIEIIYRIVGQGTKTLATWRPGEAMTVVGPLGVGFQLKPAAAAILILGRGIGTCSLTALAEHAVRRAVSVYAVASGRNRQAIVGADFYRRIGATEVLEVADDDGSSHPDALRARLLALFDGRPLDQIFVCGSQRLLRLAVALGQRCNAEVQVSLEAHMACGLGYCHGCSTGAPGLAAEAPLVCTEGPVFASVGEELAS